MFINFYEKILHSHTSKITFEILRIKTPKYLKILTKKIFDSTSFSILLTILDNAYYTLTNGVNVIINNRTDRPLTKYAGVNVQTGSPNSSAVF